MKKGFFPLILIVLSVNLIMAQPKIEEPQNYSTFIKQFVQDFNSGNYADMVAHSSSLFLKSVPEKKLIDFLDGIKNDNGEIQLVRFKYFDQRNSAVYHAELKRAWFNFIIGLDSNNMMKRLVVLNPNYNEDLPLIVSRTTMRLPFDSTWYVFWGGDSQNENYHVTARSQKNAFDFVIRDTSNKSFKTDGKKNEDYYCYGREIKAPCNGEIITVIDTVHDNIPGEMNPAQLTGNTIIIKSDKGEYILMAHLKPNSIIVKEGEKIKAGQFMGICGNSGNSSEPHLHLHIMDAPTLKDGTGIKCFFENIIVNGKTELSHSPLKGERIQNAE